MGPRVVCLGHVRFSNKLLRVGLTDDRSGGSDSSRLSASGAATTAADNKKSAAMTINPSDCSDTQAAMEVFGNAGCASDGLCRYLRQWRPILVAARI